MFKWLFSSERKSEIRLTTLKGRHPRELRYPKRTHKDFALDTEGRFYKIGGLNPNGALQIVYEILPDDLEYAAAKAALV